LLINSHDQPAPTFCKARIRAVLIAASWPLAPILKCPAATEENHDAVSVAVFTSS
jgi:hypothetical protein